MVREPQLTDEKAGGPRDPANNDSPAKRELLDRILDSELPRYANALDRLADA